MATRRTIVALLALHALVALVIAVHLGLRGDRDALVAIGAAMALAGFLVAYRRGWEPARPCTVALVALLVVGFTREPYLTREFSIAILIPPALALALTSGRWVLGVALLEYAALVLRAGTQSVYIEPRHAVLFASVVGTLALSRSMLDAALRRADGQRRQAEEARDAAERRTAELGAQRERASLLEQLLDTVEPAVFACDVDGRVRYANRAARELAREPDGRALAEVLRLEAAEGAYLALEHALARADDVVAARPDGVKVPLLLARAPTHAPDGTKTGEAIVCTDISRLKLLEEELHQAWRLESIGRIAGGVAHDFNNLLTVIGGASAMAQRSLPAGHRAREDIEEIVEATTRAAELTRQLLAFARKQVVVKRPLDLSALVLGMERMLRRVIGERIALTTVVAPEPLVVDADAGQLEQIILNLVVNARDAMPHGGTLSITTSAVGSEPGSSDGGASFAQLDVIDSGIGMSEAVQARIFDPFFTTKPRGRGTGLGLATCFRIVKQHDGEVRVTSARGQGTRMTVLLPRIAAPVEEPVTEVRALQRGSQRVLLVEDDAPVRRLMAHALRAAGYRVFEAQNGREALGRLETSPPMDVLVSDVVMPELGGPELARLARRSHPALAVVLTSGYAEFSIAPEELLDGVVFVQKPFTPRELVQRVQEAIASRAPELRRQA